MARPTKYKSDYCDQLIAHMEKGYSFETFGAIIDVTEETLHSWKREKLSNGKPNPSYHLQFSESHKRGSMLSQLFWETLGMRGIAGIPFAFIDEKGVKRTSQAFNAATYIFNMKNRFKWTDRQDITSKGKEVQNGGFIVYRPEKLPNDYDDKMKQPGATNATTNARKPTQSTNTPA